MRWSRIVGKQLEQLKYGNENAFSDKWKNAAEKRAWLMAKIQVLKIQKRNPGERKINRKMKSNERKIHKRQQFGG